MTSPTRVPAFRVIIKTVSENQIWGLAVAIIVALVTNIMTVVYIQSLQKDLQSLYKEGLIGQNSIQSARISLYSLDNLLYQLLMAKNALDQENIIDSISSSISEFESLVYKSKRLYRARKEAAQIILVRKKFTECRADIDTLEALAALDEKEQALEIITGRLADRFHKADSLLDNIDNNKMKHDIRLFKEIDYSLSISIFFTLLMLFATIGFKALVYWIKRPHGPRLTKFIESIYGRQTKTQNERVDSGDTRSEMERNKSA